jgi:alpha-galactosidase
VLIHLCGGGASLIFHASDGTLEIAHWGAELGEISEKSLAITKRAIAHGDLDVNPRNLILREHARGWRGHPALRGHRRGKSVSHHFTLVKHETTNDSLIANLEDKLAGLAIEISYHLDQFGILTVQSKVTNISDGDYFLEHLLNWLPLPIQADEILDFHGQWGKERQPERRKLSHGLSTREVFEGRTGHDYTITQIALTHATDFRNGEAWSLANAWSGNNIHHIEKLSDDNISIGVGEYLLPGEIILAKNESYTTPKAIACYAPDGLDGISNRHYSHLRARANHPKSPRPLNLNLWEAVYFDHNLEKLSRIIDKAAEVGVERVVLDDGWFGARRNDRQGLGDWVVSKEVWPNGLKPLADVVNSKGMQLGLWFEGEMIQVDSDLYRAHPDWVMQEPGRTPITGRNQQVLDITKTGAFNHVLEQVDAVLKSCNITYIKWDHNRSTTDPISNGRPAVHNQTKAIYKLFAELKKRNPGLEIESCSSGGGRIDLGMIDYVDRFWTSDQNDPLERQSIQRWTGMVIPPELLGTHVGPTHSHQTHRTSDISFRVLNALFGHAGIEWNILEASDSELSTLKEFAKFYKTHRALLHSGNIVRAEIGNAYLYGTVSEDKSEALFTYMQLATPNSFIPTVAQLHGLDPNRTYRLQVAESISAKDFNHRGLPGWWPKVEARGDQLAAIGLEMPGLRPETGLALQLKAI